MESIEQMFLARAVQLLREDYLPKIREAVTQLDDVEVWTRDGDTSNAVGNLLMHLTGNVRQHIISGVGGVSDDRNRPLEFAARGGLTRAQLLHDLDQTVAEAAKILTAFDPSRLHETRVIQSNKVMLFDDIFHSIEHFAYHTGQIILIVKAVKQTRFAWYQHLDPH